MYTEAHYRLSRWLFYWITCTIKYQSLVLVWLQFLTGTWRRWTLTWMAAERKVKWKLQYINTKYNFGNQVSCETISVFKNILHMIQVICLVQFTAEPHRRWNWPNWPTFWYKMTWNAFTILRKPAEDNDGQYYRDICLVLNYISQNCERYWCVTLVLQNIENRHFQTVHSKLALV